MSISTHDLKQAAERARLAAERAGELRPNVIGPVMSNLSESVRAAIAEDLPSGEYQRAAREAVAGDSELTKR